MAARMPMVAKVMPMSVPSAQPRVSSVLPTAAALAEPVQADDGEHRNDQQTRIRAHGIGKVNDVQELAAQQQPQKTGQHTGGDKELLEKRDLGPQDQ